MIEYWSILAGNAAPLGQAKGGTGLGLAIAKQVVEMHGGRRATTRMR